MSDDKIIITSLKKRRNRISEIRIDQAGHIFFDGELYDEKNPKHAKIIVSSEKFKRVETGDETRKMMSESKKAEKGDLVVITDIQTDNKSQKTTVKF